jgi:hypothetical protein
MLLLFVAATLSFYGQILDEIPMLFLVSVDEAIFNEHQNAHVVDLIAFMYADEYLSRLRLRDLRRLQHPRPLPSQHLSLHFRRRRLHFMVLPPSPHPSHSPRSPPRSIAKLFSTRFLPPFFCLVDLSLLGLSPTIHEVGFGLLVTAATAGILYILKLDPRLPKDSLQRTQGVKAFGVGIASFLLGFAIWNADK